MDMLRLTMSGLSGSCANAPTGELSWLPGVPRPLPFPLPLLPPPPPLPPPPLPPAPPANAASANGRGRVLGAPDGLLDNPRSLARRSADASTFVTRRNRFTSIAYPSNAPSLHRHLSANAGATHMSTSAATSASTRRSGRWCTTPYRRVAQALRIADHTSDSPDTTIALNDTNSHGPPSLAAASTAGAAASASASPPQSGPQNRAADSAAAVAALASAADSHSFTQSKAYENVCCRTTGRVVVAAHRASAVTSAVERGRHLSSSSARSSASSTESRAPPGAAP
mmetsp:Transcript_3829/g.14194  ORF Transcript_3829/g.14194 Transcript_3829/m.14194 type:complete len:283 (+) Transcript_3829:763-1611(+)